MNEAILGMLAALLSSIVAIGGKLYNMGSRLTRLEFALFGNRVPKQNDNPVFPICNALERILEKLEEKNEK